MFFPRFQPMFSTIEDIYVANIETDRGQKEKVHFFDTAGLVCMAIQVFLQYKVLTKYYQKTHTNS